MLQGGRGGRGGVGGAGGGAGYIVVLGNHFTSLCFHLKSQCEAKWSKYNLKLNV